MKILDSVIIDNYRNLMKVELKALNDINILVGPNNAGKSNILRAIELLAHAKWTGSASSFRQCEQCYHFTNHHLNNAPADGTFKPSNIQIVTHLTDSNKCAKKFKVDYTFDKEFLKNVSPVNFESSLNEAIKKVVGTNHANRPQAFAHIAENFNLVSLHQTNNTEAVLEHISALSFNFFQDFLQQHLTFCETNRLETYKGKKLIEYIHEKDLSNDQRTKLINFLTQLIDKEIIDYRAKSGKIIFNNTFEDSLENQGSGVKSIVCLATDIICAPNKSLLLIDEPELGLNPKAKLAFLNLLNGLSKEHQLFIATHDPSFLNPLVLEPDKTAIFMYSDINEQKSYIRTNVFWGEKHPEIFSGYLQHTESLKRKHIYVEGSNDVFAVQSFLLESMKNKHANNRNKNKWLEEFNKFSIQHLNGSSWMHFMYTVLRNPYHSLVILDSNKANEVIKYTCGDLGFPGALGSINGVTKIVTCSGIKELGEQLRSYPSYIHIYVLSTPNGNVEDIGANTDVRDEIKQVLDLFTELNN